MDPQNIYDDARFFAGYSSLERFGTGWQQAMEHEDLLGLLPPAEGRRVLDLGCGAGQLAHHLATSGASEVIAVDLSARMLERARAEWAHPRVTYQRIANDEQVAGHETLDRMTVRNACVRYAERAGLHLTEPPDAPAPCS